MVYKRRNFRGRKTYRKRQNKPFNRRKKSSKYSRKRQVTGIPMKKYIKVRKDILYTISSASAVGWNTIISGGAQTANLQGYGMYYGNTASVVDAGIDVTGSTGIPFWFGSYNRYYVCGSKCKVSIQSDNSIPCMATLVPTIDYALSTDSAGSGGFDGAGIDPGELPMARRVLVNAVNGGQSTLQGYVSIKKMQGITDLSDVASDSTAVGANQKPWVPQIASASVVGTTLQPTTGTSQSGVYWNLVLQNPQQFALVPGTAATVAATIRIQVTSYVCFNDRKPLTS